MEVELAEALVVDAEAVRELVQRDSLCSAKTVTKSTGEALFCREEPRFAGFAACSCYRVRTVGNRVGR